MTKPLTPSEHVKMHELNKRQKDYKPLDDYQIKEFAELLDRACMKQCEPFDLALQAQNAYAALLGKMVEINALLLADLRYWKEFHTGKSKEQSQ